MQRDLNRLARDQFDLLVVGGGITGASIARDAAMRGLTVALVEKDDFACATSAHNSKLIHGGLRYLRNFELGLVRESLAERRIWQRIAPHLVRPLPFLIPLYHAGWTERTTLSAGLTLYDGLSFDRGWLRDKAQRLPGHSFLDRKAALAREPSLDGPGLEGAFLYYDAQMYAPERLALECVMAAAVHGAACANHLTATGLKLRESRVEGIAAEDSLSGQRFDIRAKATVLATGPWSDLFLEQALAKSSSVRLVRSKGIHLIVPAMTRGDALTVATQHGHFFVLPWRGETILGTTDSAFNLPPDQVCVTETDVKDLLGLVNANLPAANLSAADVRHAYAGLRPLVSDGTGDTYTASRRAELVDHGKADGLSGLYSAVGGKWTTSRHLARNLVDRLAPMLVQNPLPCSTASMCLPGGWIDDIAGFLAKAAQSGPAGANVHLAQLYGARLPEVLAAADHRAELLQPLGPSGDIGAQVVHAVREEMALTLSDVVLRRTGIGQLGRPDDASLDLVAKLMGDELNWDAARRQAEIAALGANFRIEGQA